MQYYTIEQIGPKRSLRPNGTMVCFDVPIARTGMQIYGPDETPIPSAGIVQIEREADEVFHPDAVASLQGAPVVNEHPMDEDGGRADVTTDNYRDLAIGHVMNPRRGEGIDADVCVADLLIWDKDAIGLIDAGKRELSVGYDADYDEIGPGHGRQKNIRANHVALVERGRCGPRCSIGDTAEELIALTQTEVDERTCTCTEEDGDMTVRTTWAKKIRAAFKARDEEALENALADNGEEEAPPPPPKENGSGSGLVHVHVHPAGGNGADPAPPPDPGPAIPGDQGGAPPPAAAGGGGGDPGELLKQAITAVHQEMDEMWDAIGNLSGGAPMGDSFPNRDKRRGADEFPPKEDETTDEFGEAPGHGGGKAILPGFELEAPPGTKAADMRRARDSALFEDSFAETISLAEIIMPGVRLPTFDRAARPKATFDALCAFRSRVLDAAYAMPDTREIIDDLESGRFTSARKMTCDRAKSLFKAVARAKGQSNLAPRSTDLNFGVGVAATGGEMKSPADLQAVLDKHYASQRSH